MTLDEVYENYRLWAVKKVGAWMLLDGLPVDAADDIVQEAFISLWKTEQNDVQFPAALVATACRNRFADWVRDRKRQRRDTRKAVSIQHLEETIPGWDYAAPMSDTEASALARVEIVERLKHATPHAARQIVRRVLDPTFTAAEDHYVRKVALYRLKKKERAAA